MVRQNNVQKEMANIKINHEKQSPFAIVVHFKVHRDNAEAGGTIILEI
jgi:hypothetical protein